MQSNKADHRALKDVCVGSKNTVNYNLQREDHRFLLEKAINAIKYTKGDQFCAIKPSLHLPNLVAFNFPTSTKITLDVQMVTIH